MAQLSKLIVFLMMFLYINGSFAQDGEQLFKKCFTCHTLGKKSTGPDLVGVRAKWTDAGEGDLLIDWVKNSNALITSGKSKMANAIKDFSPTTMDAQPLSTEEITAVFDYIDSWTPPVEENAASADAAGDEVVKVVYVPNYQKNLKMFYWMLALTGVLLLAIALLSHSISVLVKSDYFKERVGKKKDNVIMTVGLIIGFTMMANASNALTFNGPGAAKEGEPWLLVENQDLVFMLAINLILLGVVFYLRRMFMNFMNMVRVAKKKEKTVPVTKKLNKILTDVVDIEEEHTILMDHEYDGIKELDNNLPPWWVWGFYCSIIFAICYMFHYHVLGTGDLQIKEYNKEMVQKQKEVEEYLVKMAMNVDETSAELLEDESDLQQGKTIFEVNCVACHMEDGSGKIGPNLTDKIWIYGYDIKELFGVIKYGTSNGMPEHASKLKPTQIQQVASYVLHLKEVENGKEAEGAIIEQ